MIQIILSIGIILTSLYVFRWICIEFGEAMDSVSMDPVPQATIEKNLRKYGDDKNE